MDSALELHSPVTRGEQLPVLGKGETFTKLCKRVHGNVINETPPFKRIQLH